MLRQKLCKTKFFFVSVSFHVRKPYFNTLLVNLFVACFPTKTSLLTHLHHRLVPSSNCLPSSALLVPPSERFFTSSALLCAVASLALTFSFLFTGAEDDLHRFAGNDSHTDYFRLVMRDGESLLIGGRWVFFFPSFPIVSAPPDIVSRWSRATLMFVLNDFDRTTGIYRKPFTGLLERRSGPMTFSRDASYYYLDILPRKWNFRRFLTVGYRGNWGFNVIMLNVLGRDRV